MNTTAIVAAFSPDPYGRAALEHATEECMMNGDRLVVVNATKGDSLVDRRYAHEDDITTLTQRLVDAGVEVEVRRDLVPDIADAVLDAARDVSARMIVVGVRRRSPVGKMLMGSVAQRVILEAHCPVVAVKPPD